MTSLSRHVLLYPTCYTITRSDKFVSFVSSPGKFSRLPDGAISRLSPFAFSRARILFPPTLCSAMPAKLLHQKWKIHSKPAMQPFFNPYQPLSDSGQPCARFHDASFGSPALPGSIQYPRFFSKACRSWIHCKPAPKGRRIRIYTLTSGRQARFLNPWIILRTLVF